MNRNRNDKMIANHRNRRATVKKTGPRLAALIIATILLASCPEPVPPATAPTGLTFTAGEGSVTLSWTAVEGAASYRIYRDNMPLKTVTGTTYTDTGLRNRTSYTYIVRAVGSTGLEGPNSEPITATPDTPPNAPTGLTVTEVTYNTVMLSWTAVEEATSYNVYRSNVGSDAAEMLVGTGITELGHTDTVVGGTDYSYTVRALKGNLLGEASNPPVTANPPTAAPDNLMSTPGDGQVTLSWDTVAGAVNYHITIGGDFTNIAAPTTMRIVTELTNGTEYTFVITSSGSNGIESAQSTITTYPIAPPDIMPVAGDREVVLSWDEVTGANSYNIYRSDTVETTFELIGDKVLFSALPYTDSDLTNNRAYTYRVHAVNRAGMDGKEGPPSESLTVTPAVPPGIPQGLAITILDRQLLLRWNEVANAVSYNIYRNHDSTPLVTDPAVIRGTTYTDTDLTNATTYTYTVRAVNSNGTVSDSSEEMRADPQMINFANLANADNGNSLGMWSDGVTMWVLESRHILDPRDPIIYAYTLETEVRDPAKDIPLAVATTNPLSIWVYLTNNVLWVLNRPFVGTATIHAYDRRNDQRISVDDFGTLAAAGNEHPRAIWSDGITMWVSDDMDDRIFAYNLSTKSRDMPKEIALATGNDDPIGLWSNTTTMWVADDGADKIFAYNLDGTPDAGNDFDLADGNETPLALWSDGDTMWVLDPDADRIYKYDLTTKDLID